MNDQQIPCKNCITLPICRSTYIHDANVWIIDLVRKCSILRSYIGTDDFDKKDFSEMRHNKAHHFLMYNKDRN